MKAPFPWFGGKSRCAHLVWERFGDVCNYVEPFFGSGAVLLGRPTDPRVETINDLDCYVANFWRAIQAVPKEVAKWANWPVNEADLHARHLWLSNREEFRERMKTDPLYCEPKIAGWWVWGISQWIGSGWCARPEWRGRFAHGGTARGINGRNRDRADGTPRRGRPCMWSMGVVRKRPNLGGHNNKGVCASGLWRQRPDLSSPGRGTTSQVHMARKLPKMDRGTASRMQTHQDNLIAWFGELAERLRHVRVCCGDWKRVVGPSPTFHIGMTGVFLDPPYGVDAKRDSGLYVEDDLSLSERVRAWATEAGKHPKMRIALCGYQEEHGPHMPADWECVAWKANCGYAGRNPANQNRHRERIWFSPACLKPKRVRSMFATE